MKVIKDTKVRIAATVQAPAFNNTRVSRSGYARVERFLTNEPVPAQVSYTGKINLG